MATIKDILADPKFQALSPEAKKVVMAKVDPNFANLGDETKQRVVAKVSTAAPAEAAPSAAGDVRSQIAARGANPPPAASGDPRGDRGFPWEHVPMAAAKGIAQLGGIETSQDPNKFMPDQTEQQPVGLREALKRGAAQIPSMLAGPIGQAVVSGVQQAGAIVKPYRATLMENRPPTEQENLGAVTAGTNAAAQLAIAGAAGRMGAKTKGAAPETAPVQVETAAEHPQPGDVRQFPQPTAPAEPLPFAKGQPVIFKDPASGGIRRIGEYFGKDANGQHIVRDATGSDRMVPFTDEQLAANVTENTSPDAGRPPTGRLIPNKAEVNRTMTGPSEPPPPGPPEPPKLTTDTTFVGPSERTPLIVTGADEAFTPDAYVKENLAARNAARGKPQSNVGAFMADAKKKLVDFAAPIEDALNKAGGADLQHSEHITNQIDRVLNAGTIASQFAVDHGLPDIVKSAPNLDYLDQYLIAKHSQTVEANGIRTGRNLAADAKLVDALGPTYEPIAAKIRDYTHSILDYSVDSGLVAPELAAKLKAVYPDYVPLQRVFADTEMRSSNSNRPIASLDRQTVVRRLAGSERQIESPIESLVQKTNDVVIQGEKNKAARMLAGYKDLPGNPLAIKEVPAAEVGTHAPQPGLAEFSYLDNGIRRTFETRPEIASAAKLLDVQRMNILGHILAAPVRIARLGITGMNVPFLAANIAKDQVTGFINSNNALATSVANPHVFTKALFEAVHHGDLYAEMAREGAIGTSFDIARDQPSLTVASMRARRSASTLAFHLVTHPGELLRVAEDVVARGEQMTRIQQYAGTKEASLKSGLPEGEARIAAARGARENTVNFSRRGEWGTVLNSAFLYLNAGIQGTRTLVRNLSAHPVATSTKIAASVFLPVSIATAWNLSDPERKRVYDDIPDFEKQNNIVIIPPNPTKNADGRYNVIKIPMSQEINNIAAVPRRSIEAAFGSDPVRAGEIAKALIGTVSPVNPEKGAALSALTPQAIKPTIEAGMNKDIFTGRNIVPDRMRRLPPENQVRPWTSGTARKIGGALGVSPIQVEHFTKASTGQVGMQGMNALDHLLAALGVIPPEQIGGEDILQGVTRRFSKASSGAKK